MADFHFHKNNFIIDATKVIIDKKKVGAKWYILLRPIDTDQLEWISEVDRVVDGGIIHGVYATEALADAEIVNIKAAMGVAGTTFY